MRYTRIHPPLPSSGIRVLFLLVAVSLPAPLFATPTCYAVTPSGAGSKTGASWSNALALPVGTAWVRNSGGSRYYLADGNYGNSLTLTTSTSGTEVIELRKAQSYDYGRTSDGCANDISSGWNASTMGSSQALIQSTGSGALVEMQNGYWTINGNGNVSANEVGCGGVQASPPANQTDGPPTPSACGIKIDDSTCTSTATNGCDGGLGIISVSGGFSACVGPNIIWENVEWDGQGLNSNGNNNSETYFWATGNCSLGTTEILHSYLHNASTTYVTLVHGGWSAGSIDHNYIWGVYDGSVNHGEAIQLQGNNTFTVSNNIFRDQQTNGDIVGVNTGTDTMVIYDNVDFCSSGGTSTTCRHNDGWLGCFQSGNNCVANNWLIYNNTLSFPSNCGTNIQSGTGNIAENNLFYNCGSASIGGGATFTQDYNSYLNSSQSTVGAHDVSVASGAANPFVSLAGGNLIPASENSLWNNRVSLSSPYNIDIAGNTFTTDRGAYQYVTGNQLGTPTNLNGSGSTTQ